MVAVEEVAAEESLTEDSKEESPPIHGELLLAASELVFSREEPPLTMEGPWGSDDDVPPVVAEELELGKEPRLEWREALWSRNEELEKELMELPLATDDALPFNAISEAWDDTDETLVFFSSRGETAIGGTFSFSFSDNDRTLSMGAMGESVVNMARFLGLTGLEVEVVVGVVRAPKDG